IGLVSAALALPVGLTLAAIMISVINRRSFGWTLRTEIDPAILLQALAVALLAALAAGLYPAFRMARARPSVALREE
ncbi:MAG TPA: FtsX-like permease family protein, partial [Methylomirabilota bacterium]